MLRTPLVVLLALLLSGHGVLSQLPEAEDDFDSIISRRVRGYRHPIEVKVTPEKIDMFPGNVITIMCTARLSEKSTAPLYMNFYRRMNEYTVMSLSSGNPGVLIQPGDFSRQYPNDHVKLLTLGKSAWYTMEEGDNLFYCKAHDDYGRSTVTYFTVTKHNAPRSEYSYRRLRRLMQRQTRKNEGSESASVLSHWAQRK